MTIKNQQTDFREVSEKIILGVRKAVRQVVEAAAANDENLVIGDKDGKSKSVPA